MKPTTEDILRSCLEVAKQLHEDGCRDDIVLSLRSIALQGQPHQLANLIHAMLVSRLDKK